MVVNVKFSVKEFIYAVSDELMAEIKKTMIKYDVPWTGKSMDTMKIDFKVEKREKIIIEIIMEGYLEYIEKGIAHVVDKMEMDELIKWVYEKVLGESRDSFYHYRMTEAMVIARRIAAKIQTWGPDPVPFVRETMNSKLTQIIKKHAHLLFVRPVR